MWDNATIRAWLANRSPDEIRTCVGRRLRNEDRTPVLSSRFEQAPEQLVQALLEHEGDLPSETYQAVIAGCTDVFESIGALLRRKRRGESVEPPEFEPLFRLARAVAPAAPAKLRGEAMELFSQIVAQDDPPQNVADAACRMVVAYPPQSGEEMLWVKALDNPAIAGLACRRLIDIDPTASETIEALRRLWRRRLLKQWKVNCHLLTKLWLDRQDGPKEQCVRLVFKPLMHEQRIRAALLEDLPTSPWGEQWNQFLTDAQQCQRGLESVISTARSDAVAYLQEGASHPLQRFLAMDYTPVSPHHGVMSFTVAAAGRNEDLLASLLHNSVPSFSLPKGTKRLQFAD